MADAPDLGSGAARRRSSSLLSRTIQRIKPADFYQSVFYMHSGKFAIKTLEKIKRPFRKRALGFGDMRTGGDWDVGRAVRKGSFGLSRRALH